MLILSPVHTYLKLYLIRRTTFIQHISISPDRIKQIQHHTATDDILQVLRRTIIGGKPEFTKNVPPAIDRYTFYRNELSFTDGLILNGDKNRYSACSLQEYAWQTSHLGLTGTRGRAAECMYWPNISNNIKDFISHRNGERIKDREIFIGYKKRK